MAIPSRATLVASSSRLVYPLCFPVVLATIRISRSPTSWKYRPDGLRLKMSCLPAFFRMNLSPDSFSYETGYFLVAFYTESMLVMPSFLYHTSPYPGRVPMWVTWTTSVLKWILVVRSDLWMYVSRFGLLKTSMEDPVSRRIQLGFMDTLWRNVWSSLDTWNNIISW